MSSLADVESRDCITETFGKFLIDGESKQSQL